jgi:hypothetical protein
VRQSPSRRVDAGKGDQRQQGRHTVQQRFDGAGTREVAEEPLLVLFDLCCHFEEGENDRRGLGLSERGLLERRGAEGMRQDLSSTSQEEPHSMRQEGGCGGAVAVEVTLDRLDLVCTIPTRTVAVLIQQNPQSARRNNFPGEQKSRWFLLLSEHLSASNYPGAASYAAAR